MAQDLLNVPGGGEVWRIDGQPWLIYYVPNSEPPVPMGWRITNDDDLNAMFGPGQPVTYAKQIGREQWRQTGGVDMGVRVELANESDHPFEVFLANYEREAQVRPWLKDPEVLAHVSAAILEGREVTEAELKTTEWWKTHTDAERKWMTISASDPSTASEMIADNRFKVRDLLLQAGVSAPPGELVNVMADRWTRGDWSQDYLREQARLLGDRYTIGYVDEAVQETLQGINLETNRDVEDKVRQSVTRWLGPAYAAGWNEQHIAQWAAQLRTDPNAEVRLTEMLKKQRLALFPEYENENLAYEDIAAPWRSFAQQQWGQVPDETDPLFQKVIRLNDAEAAADLLRKEGVRRGVGKVVDDALKGSQQALGSQVQQSLV